ncbi:MAG: hypothetical protein DSY55_04060 [Clostridia bacterium]|nr:MAG: hypothetical protein DSY55_04060 [Clostridia bacterium]
MTRRPWLLWLWIIGILAPMAWLARFIPGYNALFNALFGPPWMHWVSHAVLFAVLALLLLSMMRPPGGNRFWWRILEVFLLMLLIAFLQERLQLWYKLRPWGGDEWFDLAVDGIGGVLGTVVFWAMSRRHERLRVDKDENGVRRARPGE